MNKVIIIIDWVPNNFSAAVANGEVACVATGKTLEDVKKNIMGALAFHIDGILQDGGIVPVEFSEDWEPVYHMTTRAQLKYADKEVTCGRNWCGGAAVEPLCEWATSSQASNAKTYLRRNKINLCSSGVYVNSLIHVK